MKSAMRSLYAAAATITLLSGFWCAGQATPRKPAAPLQDKQVQAHYGRLPLTFEANRGQIDPRVKFLAHGSGYAVMLTSGEMVLALRSHTTSVAQNSANPAAAAAPSKSSDALIQMKLMGANPNPALAGEQLQAGKVNYFLGNDPQKWQTNVPTYKQVRYQSIYPGIDLVYYGNQSRVEHDFILAPGADPKLIQLEVQGADRLSLDSDGSLVLHKGSDEIRLLAPELYQQFHGMRVPVTGHYTLQNSTRVSFTVGPYDKTMPLVIDPVMVYGTFLGGLADDKATAIAVDSAGSAYVTGWTQSNNFPLAAGPAPSGQNVFLAKLDVSGSSLVYADYIGGSSDEVPSAIALDASNHVFVTGYTYSSDYPTVNPFQAAMAGTPEGFVTEISADGASLLYSTYLGGSSSNYVNAIALDADGNIYVAGGTYSLDFPLANAYQATVAPNQGDEYGQYAFLSKLTADGSALLYSTYYAGSQTYTETCYHGVLCWPSPYGNISAIAVDAAGNAYVTGVTNTFDFPVSEAAYETTNGTLWNVTVTVVGKFDPSGNLVYSTYFGAVPQNSSEVLPAAIAVDSQGEAIIAGISYDASNALPITNTSLCNPESDYGCSGAFLAKLDAAGSTVAFATLLTSENADPQSLVLDPAGNIYVLSSSGWGISSFLTNPLENYTNGYDLLLQEVDPTASTQLFATFLGGYGNDYPGGIALDSSGAMYVAGYTNSTDYPVNAAALQGTIGGNNDGFVTKIGTASSPSVALSPSLVQFSIRPVGSVSQPNTSLLRNMGSAALTISNLTTTGDFAETDDCGSSIAAAATCTFTITFNPTAPGPRFGSIMIEDNAAGSPHFINLVGNGATPVVALSATSLSFPSMQINQTSSAQTVSLTNNGNATLLISSFTNSVEYPLTSDCTASLGIGSSCSFHISFKPTAGGAQNGTLTIYDNAPDSPQVVALTGSGYVTTGTVAPASLTFSSQNVGTTSSSQSVVVSNTGSNSMTISSIEAGGDFAETDTCTTAPVAASATCTIHVTFSPTAAGSRSGTLTISDNAQGNPHTVTLGGTGLAGVAHLSASSLTFSGLAVGTASTAQTITVTNPGNGALTVASVQANGDFSQTNNCTSVAASGTCTIQVTFTPTTSGSRTGTLTLTDSALDSPQVISLTGSGIDFNMPSSGGTSSITAGATATYEVAISPVGGTFATAIALTCAGVPAFSTCTIAPTSVTPGASAASVTVSIKTTGTTAQLAPAARGPVYAWLVVMPGLGLFGIFVLGKNGRKRAGLFLLMFVLLGTLLYLPGCSGTSTGTPPPVQKVNSTPPGTYTVLVIGTSGSVQHFSSLTLTVQ